MKTIDSVLYLLCQMIDDSTAVKCFRRDKYLFSHEIGFCSFFKKTASVAKESRRYGQQTVTFSPLFNHLPLNVAYFFHVTQKGENRRPRTSCMVTWNSAPCAVDSLIQLLWENDTMPRFDRTVTSEREKDFINEQNRSRSFILQRGWSRGAQTDYFRP